MNKEKAIRNINRMGNAGRIISIIIIVILSIGELAALLGIGALAAIPEGLVTMSGNMEMQMDVDTSLVNGPGAGAAGQLAGSMSFGMGGLEFGTDVVQNGNVISYQTAPISSNFDIKEFIPVVAAGIAVITMAIISCVFILKLCNAFRSCHSPFEENVVKKMRNLAFSLIPWTVISSFSSMLSSFAISNLIINGQQRLHFSVDLGMLLVVAVILMLSVIFRYGSVLQQESDETL